MVAVEEQPSNKVLVGSMRKPATYVDLCSEHIHEHGEVHLSGLGRAISSVVGVAELMKAKMLATEKSIQTTCETLSDEDGTRQKPKMDIVLVKTPEFERLYAEAKNSSAPMHV